MNRIKKAYERACINGYFSVSPASNWGRDEDGEPIRLDSNTYYVVFNAYDGEHVAYATPDEAKAQEVCAKMNTLGSVEAVDNLRKELRNES